MPLPFILGAAALVAAGYGVKKGADAKSDLDDAERYQRWARQEADEVNEKLDDQKSATNRKLEILGKEKQCASEQINAFFSLIQYTDEVNKNKVAMPMSSTDAKMGKIIITKAEEAEILEELGIIDKNLSTNQIQEKLRAYKVDINTLTNAAMSVASGAVAGLAAAGGAYIGVGALATAGTGAAISGLSGAAATNATLAWLGGGTLASGGFGMAGGMAVMGGLVAGPLLAIGGAVFAAKAASAKDEAYEALTKVRANIKKVEIVISSLSDVAKHSQEFTRTLTKLYTELIGLLDVLREVSQTNIEFQDLDENGKSIVKICYGFSDGLAQLVRMGLMTDDGKVNSESKKLLSNMNQGKTIDGKDTLASQVIKQFLSA